MVRMTVIKETIITKLTEAFQPAHLEVRNDSDRHNVPPGSESHFRVLLVSDHFAEQKLLARHRAVNGVLAQELAGPVHALALHTYTSAEWQRQQAPPEPPDCLGGQKAERSADTQFTN